MAEINNRTKGFLALATGRVYQGFLFGAHPNVNVPAEGEVVFNTSLTGYQEILTDPSYKGQIVVMTPSHIGNYGINPEDVESGGVHLSGFVVQELSRMTSNWRSNDSLHSYLTKHNVTGLAGVDTRAITRELRSHGAVPGLISADEKNLSGLVKRAKALPRMDGQDFSALVTCREPHRWTEGSGPWADEAAKKAPGKKVVVMDFGVKRNILRCLVDRGCEVTVVPSSATAEEILAYSPDGVLASNGPGDPAAVKTGVSALKGLISHNLKRLDEGKKPFALFGICLGHQMMGLALGGETYKLKFGHHGGNHPVKDIETGRVDVTTQNHGFAVSGEKTASGEWQVKGNKDALITHINLNDNSVQGLRHKKLPLFSVQGHPEASCGPHDARHLFDRFVSLMEKN